MRQFCRFLHWVAMRMLRVERFLLNTQLMAANNEMRKKGTIPQFSAQLRIREDLLSQLIEINRFLDRR